VPKDGRNQQIMVTLLHEISSYLDSDLPPNSAPPTYWYEGETCQGDRVRLPRTALAEAIAQGLMRRLSLLGEGYLREGKMYGVLLVQTETGEQRVLQAFSGLWQGRSQIEGWVPPIPGRDRVAIAEAETLAALAALKQGIIALQQIPERQQYEALHQQFAQQLAHLIQSQSKQERQQERQRLRETLEGEALAIALSQLDQQSRQEKGDRRRLKQARDAVLGPLQTAIDQANQRQRTLKQQRQRLSQQLQAQLHAAYRLTNFAGESIALQQLATSGALPTGTGDCCAPKLLHFAASHGFQPLALAEFWWGSTSAHGDRIPGQFYPACQERCQPLMGFLLSGLNPSLESRRTIVPSPDCLPILYEDETLIAVYKPAGLLSVPGRYADRQDSVLSRLRLQSPAIVPVHRLDQDTSGILLLAKNGETQRHLQQQFQQRQVTKVYEAVLADRLDCDRGQIDLPLWGDPSDHPYQRVDPRGKPSTTQFVVLSRTDDRTRLEFFPLTGRSHQLRVHAADRRGLGIPILGDRLYGNLQDELVTRLHLHAKAINFQHPSSGQPIQLQIETPF
jgi:tRNA pseudouridine32 synthase / 23S rRNA pseudouridine746 synthase